MQSDQPNIPTLLITGPVGVGKTAVAAAISEALDHANIAHAMVDLDALRWCHPNPSDDPFHAALGLRNLAAVWSNYHAAGATRLILADVLEANEDLPAYVMAVPGAAIQVVRLHASIPTIWERLTGRDSRASLEWYQYRAIELADLMEQRNIGHIVVDTEGKSITEVAEEVLQRSGWMQAISAENGS